MQVSESAASYYSIKTDNSCFLCNINYILHIIIALNIMFLIILNQNNFPSLLLHLFSDDEGGAITCHSHEINHNHPINSTWTKSSPAHICSCCRSHFTRICVTIERGAQLLFLMLTLNMVNLEAQCCMCVYIMYIYIYIYIYFSKIYAFK